MWKTFSGGPAAAPVQSPAGGPAIGGGTGQWHPTIIYMVVLLVAEILAVAWLSRTLLR